MFENIIEQGAVIQLRDDIQSRRVAPSMLFYGPHGTGKGSAALELARVFSCENEAAWKCSCPSCRQHRYLQHDDLLVLGNRSFAAEIAACQSAFLRNSSNQNSKLLFIRSIKKLLIRFSPVVMEDEPKLSKVLPVLQSLDEKLNDFSSGGQLYEKAALEKLCGSMIKDALTLENDGLSSIIPIGQIRRACAWCRLSPNGKRKMLIIENAQDMREEGRNSLLKLLEEPPVTVSIVLTAQRRESIIQTILSRLRPYRFLRRSEESEKEVIRRVFQDTVKSKTVDTGGSLVSEYLGSFLPHNAEKMETLASWFMVSFARIVSLSIKNNNAESGKKNSFDPVNILFFFNILEKRYASIADTEGLVVSENGMNVIKILLSKSKNFERDSFSRFMKICLDMIGETVRFCQNPLYITYYDIFRKNINEAISAVDVYNINAASALENLIFKLKSAAAGR